MSAESLGTASGAGVLVVQAISPRSLANFKQNFQNFDSLLQRMEQFGKLIGEDLKKSVLGINQDAAVIAQIRKFDEDRIALQEQCKQLQQTQAQAKEKLDGVVQQLEDAVRGQHESEQKRQELLKELEKKKAEFQARSIAMERWRQLFQKKGEDLQEREKDLETERLKNREADEKVQAKQGVVVELQRQLQLKEVIVRQKEDQIRDREEENCAIQAQNLALRGDLALHVQEKANWENIAREQKEAIKQKDDHIGAQGQCIQDLENNIQVQKGRSCSGTAAGSSSERKHLAKAAPG